MGQVKLPWIGHASILGEEFKKDGTAVPGAGSMAYVLAFDGGPGIYYVEDTGFFSDMAIIRELCAPEARASSSIRTAGLQGLRVAQARKSASSAAGRRRLRLRRASGKVGGTEVNVSLQWKEPTLSPVKRGYSSR